MGGMRPMTPEERKAYGLPPDTTGSAEGEQKRRDDAVAKAAAEGRLVEGTDANGNDVTRVLPNSAGDDGSGNTAGRGAMARPFEIGPDRIIKANRVDSYMFTDPTYEPNKKALADALVARAGKQPLSMTGASLDTGQIDQTRARQMGLVDALTRAASGDTRSSAAQAALRAGSDEAAQTAMAIARSGRGSPGIAMKQALAEQGRISQQTANQSAMIAGNEQMSSRQQLADALSGMRQQDIGVATTQAGLQQDTMKTNLASALQEREAVDKMTQYYTSLGLTLDAAQAAARQEYERLRINSYAQNRAADAGIFQAQNQRDANTATLVSNLLGTAASAAGAAIKGG